MGDNGGYSGKYQYYLLTGAWAESSNGGLTYTAEVVDRGDWWLVLMSSENESNSDNLYLAVYPAIGFTIDSQDTAALGTCEYGNLELHIGKTIEQCKGSPIFTEGAAVTRNPDSLTYPSAGNIQDLRGTASAEASTFWTNAGAVSVALCSNGIITYVNTDYVSNRSITFDQNNSNQVTGGPFREGVVGTSGAKWGAQLQAFIANEEGTAGTAYNGFMANGIDITVGARTGGIQQWNGTIRNVNILDSDGSTIETMYVEGDGTRYGTIPRVSIPETDSFEVAFDWLRHDISGTTSTGVISNLDDEPAFVSQLFVSDASHASTPNGISISFTASGTNYSIINATDGVSEGQWASVLVRVSRLAENQSSLEAFVDGASTGSVQAPSRSFVFKAIGKFWDNIGVMSNGAAFQNIVVTNTTTNTTWRFPLDESEGTVINNTDPTTGGAGTEGYWTPDAEWKPVFKDEP